MSGYSPTRRLLATTLISGVLIIGPAAGAFGTSSTLDAPDSTPSSSDSATILASADASPGSDGQGPQFYDGSVIDVSEDVQGDVYAAGQHVTISGDVSGDVIAAAQTIDITGTIDGNVRLAAQEVSISGEIERSGTVFAATVDLTEQGSIGADLVGAAAKIDISGDLERDLVASVEELQIDGSVGGDVTYYSAAQANISSGAVDGEVERIAPSPAAEEPEASPGQIFVVWLLGLLYALVALSLITVLAGLLLPRRLTRVTDQLRHSPWKALLVGFLAAITVPIVLLVLLITIIGAPLALLGALTWLLMTLVTFIYTSFFLGRLILRRSRPPAVMALLGGVILIIALHIPWVNIIVWFAMVFFGLGAQLLDLYDHRPRRAQPQPTFDPDGTNP